MNILLPTAMCISVSVLIRTVTLVMVALWGLATWHCNLELMPGLEFLSCCQHPDTAPHQDNDCDEDGCAVVESGLYKLEEQAASAPIPSLVLSVLLPLWEATAPSVHPPVESLSSAPPELPRIWQFSFRTALPPRAPSFVS